MLKNSQVKDALTEAETLFDQDQLNTLLQKKKQLEEKTLSPDFWEKSDAQDIMQKISELKGQVDLWQGFDSIIQDTQAALELKQEFLNQVGEQNHSDKEQLDQNLANYYQKLKKMVKKIKLNQYLDGKFDHCQAILSIHAGQGGTEAMDWAEMLFRMYVRFFEKQNWKYKMISESRGEDAGIKEVSFEVSAPYAYGFLKGEMGTHRLVRQSPFNADNLRQTSFALVEILPILGQEDEVEINKSDLSWNFTRSGGAGGQSVNKVNSAVELTHKPTNITVKCREERSQVQNKQRALQILKAKLALKQEEERQQKLKKAKGEHHNASWGTQIRNYVLHPYHLVKDTRTGVETNDTDAVLDGNLDEFIEAQIQSKIG